MVIRIARSDLVHFDNFEVSRACDTRFDGIHLVWLVITHHGQQLSKTIYYLLDEYIGRGEKSSHTTCSPARVSQPGRGVDVEKGKGMPVCQTTKRRCWWLFPLTL